MRSAPDSMVIVAILVSRVEAMVTASMLRAAGIDVCVGANHHASVEVNSLLLGSHRLWIPACQLEQASAVIRRAGLEGNWQFSRGLQRAVLRFLAIWMGSHLVLILPYVLSGLLPITVIAILPVSALTVPVNPQGRGDYYLCPMVA